MFLFCIVVVVVVVLRKRNNTREIQISEKMSNTSMCVYQSIVISSIQL